ncbi:MAG: helix-turn-helix transcriptional regulator [Clostridia bacterium]|nr:helix-turn-helix transcriptional regulator [Clostridia bacterium]
MRYLSAAELLSEEIFFRNICVLPIREPLGYEAVFSGEKRQCSVLFLYLAGQREYSVSQGKGFFLNPGEILYVPQYASYRFRITETGEEMQDYAIAVNFEMTDRNGEPVCLGKSPQVLLKDTLSHYFSRFHRALSIDTGAKTNTLLLQSSICSLCYEIFRELQLTEAEKEPWSVLLPAIDLIESTPAEDISIPELAKRCGVSETRFRQLFNRYTGGESAICYRNRLRIEQVERMLRTEQVTVEYAAREAGFRDMSHFYRMYKKYRSHQNGNA